MYGFIPQIHKTPFQCLARSGCPHSVMLSVLLTTFTLFVYVIFLILSAKSWCPGLSSHSSCCKPYLLKEASLHMSFLTCPDTIYTHHLLLVLTYFIFPFITAPLKHFYHIPTQWREVFLSHWAFRSLRAVTLFYSPFPPQNCAQHCSELHAMKMCGIRRWTVLVLKHLIKASLFGKAQGILPCLNLFWHEKKK